MKLDLYDKVVESLNDLKEHPCYSAHVNRFKTRLTPEDELHIFEGLGKNIILEIRDENTVINHVNAIFYNKSVGTSYIWNGILNMFAKGLEKRLGHKVKIWDKQVLSLYEKVAAAAEDLKENGPDHKKIVKDYVVTVSYDGHIFVYDSGTIIFKIQDGNKLISKGEYKGIDLEWDKLVNFFVNSLEEKLGYKIKVKQKP